MIQTYDDDREIWEIVFVGSDDNFMAGKSGVTKIEAYREAGDTLWFAIYRDTELPTERVNSRDIGVVRYFPMADY